MVRESVNQRYVPHARTGKKANQHKIMYCRLAQSNRNALEKWKEIDNAKPGQSRIVCVVLRGNGLEIFHVASRSEPFLGHVTTHCISLFIFCFYSDPMVCLFFVAATSLLHAYIKCCW